MLVRDLVGLPLILAYMVCLVLAACPQEIRPSVLDGASRFVYDGLESVGVRAGMPVFGGTVDARSFVVRSRCIVVEGTDATGTETRLHPLEPCPREGFRWRPAVYEHMLFHWILKGRVRLNPSNLWAMGDHFCNASPDRDLVEVEISMVRSMIDYETGLESTRSRVVGRVRCRS